MEKEKKKKAKAKLPTLVKKAKEKLRKTVRYLPVKDASKAKELLDPANDSQKAAVYRIVAKAERPPTFAEVMAAVKYESDSKDVSTCVRWYLSRLKRDGLVESVVSKEVKAKEK
jgi:hypothetical protein